MAEFYEHHAGAVRHFCATVCQPERVEEAIEAAFVDFLGRALAADAESDLTDLLRRATREVAASRIEVHSHVGPRVGTICRSLPELLASRANGELPRRDKPLLKHLRGCDTCQNTEATLEAAELAFEEESWINPPERCREAWLELAADGASTGSAWEHADERNEEPVTRTAEDRSESAPVAAWRTQESPRPANARPMRETVIVTGGAGFIGSHLVDALLAEGRRVVVIDDRSSGDANLVHPEADLAVADITDEGSIDPIFDRADPTAIYHLAAQSSVTASVQDPRHDCEVNVRGTLNVLEAARRCNAPVTFSSTGALYGKDAPIPTPERFIPSPLPPYGASKWAAETYVNTWANSSQLPHSILRISNVYGPRQSPHGEAGVVAIFSYALWRGERPQMYGHGKPTRDYIHVADVIEAMMRASGRRGTVNISTGIETSVEELYSILSSASASSIEPEPLPLREGELQRSAMDPSLAEWMLQWRAQIALVDGIPHTYRELVAEFEAAQRTLAR